MTGATNVVNFSTALKHRNQPSVESAAAHPFVKWAGGKRSLVSSLVQHFPEVITTYWEPFVGGGAVFFTFAHRMERAVLSDTNEDLVITYQVVKTDVDALIERLRKHQRKHGERQGKQYADGQTYYQRVRAQEPDDPVEVAARFIYLNKTCFNGLYRVNKNGKFNVPEGSYAQPVICDVERLRAAHRVLAKATIKLGDFSRVVAPDKGDLIYCDPPYDGCFTSYQADGFRGDSQSRLRDCAKAWAERGATVVLSNADTDAMRMLYAGWEVHTAVAPRSINSNGDGRGAAAELIITGGQSVP